MTEPILVTGGTGTIGSRVVPLLRAAGSDVRVLTRHTRENAQGIEHVYGDTVKGIGLEAALHGIRTVLHLAGGASGDDIAAHRLAEAARIARIDHLLLISVVGADRMPIGYFRKKAAAEHAYADSGVPNTILRIAQLHDFVLPVARTMSRLRLAPRDLHFESIDVDAVAAHVQQLACGSPSGRVSDLAGPEVLDAITVTRMYNDAKRLSRGIHGFGMPGTAGTAYRAGHNLSAAPQRASITWSSFLATN
ncbi:NAD(P)H-binding protein [Arthrobacter sp. ISL-48]|uniref:SDR family oxidoreductase n=1 Tax=Arthrobacter sp. ISL-48 TaxID=2819110 RepID=UPI001BE81381|nr:NAD(P)H-binding protein [Arthrobacter sp. ISL-48]MBT2531578.1 NAD(P)H-binding protein [Arthrobacter sp. ISL-48]